MSRSTLFTRRAALALGAAAVLGVPARAEDKPAAKPPVEVVFVLDTTGSMGGLIEGAKAKIWAICNQIASGKPTPDLKVGLVAFACTALVVFSSGYFTIVSRSSRLATASLRNSAVRM